MKCGKKMGQNQADRLIEKVAASFPVWIPCFDFFCDVIIQNQLFVSMLRFKQTRIFVSMAQLVTFHLSIAQRCFFFFIFENSLFYKWIFKTRLVMGRVFNILALCLVIGVNIERLIDSETKNSALYDVEPSVEGMKCYT